MRFSVHLCQRKFLNITSSFFHSCFTWFVHPVTSFCQFFVHQIYVWNQIHVWIQICSEWNETTLDGSRCLALMYVQVLGWSYVITPGMQRHARDLRISTQITVPRPESHDSWSDPPNPECHPTPPSRAPVKPQTYGSGSQLGLPGNLISSSI